ncbi:condensation domain-containing protein [Amycolatopsis sp. NBC_01488]|uniref:condensation domain-containing protein n=1 Tax=Amycolatopsis sp. NBC_01488 TaxID=2903563 RepID=UPI002E2CCD29|nr:condensation domain-containing protein [Amycolatopsis sp. NBC_01488]
MTATDSLRLLTAQSEVWAAHEVDPDSPQFNCAGYLELSGPLQRDLLDRAVEQVDSECEALRVRPDLARTNVSGALAAGVAEAGGSGVEFVDLTGAASVADGKDAARSAMAEDLDRPLRLGIDSLVRMTLFRLAPEHHLFYLRIHHVLLDGYGQVLYWRRLARVYSALVTGNEPPPSSFGRLRDLIGEERGYVASADFARDQSYWLDRMADPPARMNLGGTPEPRRRVLRTAGDVAIAMRELHLAAAVLDVHWSVLGTAALATYLHRLTGQEDMVLGFPVRARTTRLALTTPAMLANELPLRLSVSAAVTTAELVVQANESIVQALRHQRYRAEEVHRALRARHGHVEYPAVVANLVSFDSALTFGACAASVCQLSTGPVRDLSMDFYGGTQDGPLRLGVSSSGAVTGRSDLDAHRARFGEFLAVFLAAPGNSRLRSLELPVGNERAGTGLRSPAPSGTTTSPAQ